MSASTTMVCSIAPDSFRVRSSRSTSTFRLPMRTYTTMRSVPSWLALSCDKNVLLPDFESPKIAIRWPSTIGKKLSTAVTPLASCSSSILRSMIPGAGVKIPDFLVAFIAPLPSSGWPIGLTTRPTKPSPTGTLRISFSTTANTPIGSSSVSMLYRTTRSP